MTDQLKPIYGEGGGGKGGGGRAAQEAANTLRSTATVKVVEVLSEGPIEGICGGAKGIYINDTPLQNSTGGDNFPRVSWDYRVGLPNQTYMPGFPSVMSEIIVGAPVNKVSGPVVRTTSAANIDAMIVTIQLPQGLATQDMSTGDINGGKVEFSIETKLSSSGAWSSAITYGIEGKTTSPYEHLYRVERPAGTGTWDVRVSRVTDDPATSAVRNTTTWSRLTEIQDVKLPYNDTAIVGIAIDAESTGGQIPVRSYLVKGLIIPIPNNYNPTTRTYTGTWDGTFTTSWSDNPAWVLWDLLTNTRYGLGEFISSSQVDKWSFYNAAVYNDQLVNDGKGGTEPRFTFNAVIQERTEAYRLLQMVAGAMRGSLVYMNGLITLIQDRPASAVKLITKSNVLDGKFSYRSSGLFERHTAFNVTFNDRYDRHLQRVVTIDPTTINSIASTYESSLLAAQARYGYNPTDIAAFGATTQGQAIRAGLYALDTEINQTELCDFKMSLNGFDLMPGDVVKIYDEDYTGSIGGGRIVSVSGTTVVLDRSVTLTTGSKIDVLLADGKTIQTKNILATSGTTNTVVVDSAFSQSVTAGYDYIVTTTASPRQFKIIGIKQEDTNVISLETVLYDPNKFSRIDANINTPSEVFSNYSGTAVTAPTNLTTTVYTRMIDGTPRYSIVVSWSRPTTGVASTYSLKWRRDLGDWTTVNGIASLSYEIQNVVPGSFDIAVSSISSASYASPFASTTQVITVDGTGTSPYNAPIALSVIGGGTAFTGQDINFTWLNPSTNSGIITAAMRNFEVRYYDPTTLSLLHAEFVDYVPFGTSQTHSYTYAMNNADGGPRRSVKVEVRIRDSYNNLTLPATAVFTNSTPAMPTNASLIGGYGSVFIKWDPCTESDYAGTIVWVSTTNNFTPSSTSVAFDGKGNTFTRTGLADGTRYYVRIAHYDTFGKAYDGTGLTLTPQYQVDTQAALDPGIPSGAVLPSGDNTSHMFYNTADGKLYRYFGGAWIRTVSALDISGTINDAQIAALAASKITGTLSDSQLAAISAAKITGAITSTQITDGAISTPKLAAGAVTASTIAANTITSSQIAAGTITATEIAAGTITSAKIAANTITAGNIASGTITTNEIAANTITAADIAANTITGDRLVAGTITASQIAASTITSSNIAANTITSGNIAANTITSSNIAANTITATNIATSTISTDRLIVGSVSANVTSSQLADVQYFPGSYSSWTSGDVVSGSITCSGGFLHVTGVTSFFAYMPSTVSSVNYTMYWVDAGGSSTSYGGFTLPVIKVSSLGSWWVKLTIPFNYSIPNASGSYTFKLRHGFEGRDANGAYISIGSSYVYSNSYLTLQEIKV